MFKKIDKVFWLGGFLLASLGFTLSSYAKDVPKSCPEASPYLCCESVCSSFKTASCYIGAVRPVGERSMPIYIEKPCTPLSKLEQQGQSPQPEWPNDRVFDNLPKLEPLSL